MKAPRINHAPKVLKSAEFKTPVDGVILDLCMAVQAQPQAADFGVVAKLARQLKQEAAKIATGLERELLTDEKQITGVLVYPNATATSVVLLAVVVLRMKPVGRLRRYIDQSTVRSHVRHAVHEFEYAVG